MVAIANNNNNYGFLFSQCRWSMEFIPFEAG